MTGRPGSEGSAILSNGESRPRARFPHRKDLLATVEAQTLELIPATTVYNLDLMHYRGEKSDEAVCIIL